MKRAIYTTLFVFACYSSLYGQDTSLSFYKQIVSSNRLKLTPSTFYKLENEVYSKPESSDNYYTLAKVFAKTSERVWAVVYGEIYCNLTSDSEHFLEISAMLGKMYKKSLIYKSDTEFNISFTKISVINSKSKNFSVPFGMNFELAIAYGFTDFESFRNLSIATINETRQNQLRVWKEKNLTEHALINWHQRIFDAGLLEPYNYWLFQKFRPIEYKNWQSKNLGKLKSFHSWRKKNQINFTKKNFHCCH